MAAKPGKVYINHKTAEQLLRSGQWAAEVNAVAAAVAAKIGPGAFVEAYTTDRNAAAVLVPTWLQAREGALTKAAGALGLHVAGKK